MFSIKSHYFFIQLNKNSVFTRYDEVIMSESPRKIGEILCPMSMVFAAYEDEFDNLHNADVRQAKNGTPYIACPKCRFSSLFVTDPDLVETIMKYMERE